MRPDASVLAQLHLGVDADTARSSPRATAPDVDDASQVGPLLDQVERPVASFTGETRSTETTL